MQGRDGNFYGTTVDGGNTNGQCTSGCGTVFKITPGGTLTTLYSFTGGLDQSNPYAGLIQASDGNFYGTTFGHQSLPLMQKGTIFRITPKGKLTTLYQFKGESDGAQPYAGLVQATDGNLYGTDSGLCCGYGSVFEITLAGAFTTLHNFDFSDGAWPFGGLVQDTDGNFYGTTSSGGAAGTVFSLSAGLGPFVETQPTSGKVAKTVKILGTNLMGATSVSFNGAVATFKVISSSEISTSVPAGATTGTVQVLTPGGTLSSNVPFRVVL